MAEKRMVRPCVIASVIALVGLLTGPGGLPSLWGRAQDQPQMAAMPAPATPQSNPRLTAPAPTTLEDYASYVQDRLQAGARRVDTPGIADVRLTIDRDGTVRQTQVTRLDGPEALRTQLMSMVSQMQLPPLPTGTVDALVVDSIVAFNYPGSDTMDRFGRIS